MPVSVRRPPTAFYLVAALALGLTACGDSATNPTPGTAVTVSDNAFSPVNLGLSAGGTVTWTWAGQTAHNVTWEDVTPGGTPIAGSPTQTTGSYTRTFSTAGTYQYYCTLHGSPTGGMRGTITVN